VLLRKSHQPDYVRVHRAVYDDIDARQIYGILQVRPCMLGRFLMVMMQH